MIDNYSSLSMKHEGQCYKCDGCGPANSEEYMAKDAARILLLDKDGKYWGDDTVVFLNKIHADNDTRAPNNFIQVQNDIVGVTAD